MGCPRDNFGLLDAERNSAGFALMHCLQASLHPPSLYATLMPIGGGTLVSAALVVCQVAELRDRRRATEQITLHFVAGLALQKSEFVAGFDAFGKNRKPEAAAEGPSTARTMVAACSLEMDRGDERAINLDLVERKGAQIG